MSKVFGVIAEYNPFHNGHKAMLDHFKSKGYGYCVAVMSGNFVQRSLPAVTEKRIRTKSALLNGVDLVIELPLPYAVSSAQYFAYGGVYLLKATGIIDAVAFGSEEGNINNLAQIGHTLNSSELDSCVKELLQSGITYAKARSMGVGMLLGQSYAEILEKPNNILGVEYINAAKKLSWQPSFETMTRKGVDHDSIAPQQEFASASFLRKLGANWQNMSKYVPDSSLNLYKEAEKLGLYPSNIDKVELAVLSRLRSLDRDSLSRIIDISEGLENRLLSSIKKSTNLNELVENLKTKRYPLSRIRRIILAAFLGIDRGYLKTPPPYIRILGFNDKGEELLGAMKDKATLPFSHSLAQLREIGGNARMFAELESASTDQYSLSLPKAFPCGMDYTQPVVVV